MCSSTLGVTNADQNLGQHKKKAQTRRCLKTAKGSAMASRPMITMGSRQHCKDICVWVFESVRRMHGAQGIIEHTSVGFRA